MLVSKIRTFTAVPEVIFAEGAFNALNDILAPKRSQNGAMVFLVDHFFEKEGKLDIPLRTNDLLLFVDTTDEPTTMQIDSLKEQVENKLKLDAVDGVIGIGGGSVMDCAKALSLVLTNGGSAQDYQGWDIPQKPGVFKVGIPTISGTGSEVSRTAVLTGPVKKQGINSVHSLFDMVVLDPTFLKTVPQKAFFYTVMDSYIHCVESLCGTYLNEFSRSFAEKSLDLIRKYFFQDGTFGDIMMASYMGGSSIIYSEVGICHALSYGISYEYKYHHGEANCIVFDQLEEFYPDYIDEFRKMLKICNIELPQGVTSGIEQKSLDKMTELALLMERPLENALGSEWRNLFTPNKIHEIYARM